MNDFTSKQKKKEKDKIRLKLPNSGSRVLGQLQLGQPEEISQILKIEAPPYLLRLNSNKICNSMISGTDNNTSFRKRMRT